MDAQRAGALERAGLALEDWHHTRTRLAHTEARMVAVLDELGLTRLVTSIAGVVAAAQREVIDAQHAGSRNGRQREAQQHPQGS